VGLHIFQYYYQCRLDHKVIEEFKPVLRELLLYSKQTIGQEDDIYEDLREFLIF
jgi:hypothetical protein